MEVGSAEMAEQLKEGVGVSGMIGFSTIGASVDSGVVVEEQAINISATIAMTIESKILFFIID
jgi:hypothetical protein